MKPRLVICRSNPIAPDPRVEKEARTLSQAGYEVTLVGWDRTSELPQQDQIHGILCYRLSIAAEYASGMRNFPHLLRWQWGLLTWLVRHRQDYDLIHACDFDTVLPALLCKWLYQKKVVYDIFDFYADHLRSTPDPIKNVIRLADMRAINRADAVILVDDARREQIQGSQPHRLTVIYNSPEDIPSDIENQEASDPAVIDRPENSQLHIVYVGLLQIERGLFELLSVLSQHPEWSLGLAGFGGDESRILEKIQHMSNVNWYGRISYSRALKLSAAADTLFATYDPTIPNHRYSSPNKVFEAMLLGKPVIVAQDTNMDRIIRQAGCGLVVPYGSESDLEAALLALQDAPELRKQLGNNARKAYDTTYSWEIMQKRLLDLYAAVLV